MKRVLITGKGSYIGSKVRDWLEANPDKYEVEELDMMSPNWKDFDFSGFDTIYHVAGIAHRNDVPDSLYEQVNHLLAVKVAEKAEKAAARQFIFMSSGAVYSQNDRNCPHNHGFHEKNKCNCSLFHPNNCLDSKLFLLSSDHISIDIGN